MLATGHKATNLVGEAFSIACGATVMGIVLGVLGTAYVIYRLTTPKTTSKIVTL